MDLGMKDRSVLVLASSAGIGRAIATEFAREGANVTLFSRNEERLREAGDWIERETGRRPAFAVGDVTKREDIESAVAVAAKTGPVFTLVNNAGGPKPGTFDKFDDAEWTEAFELTLMSVVRACRAVLPMMRENGGGRIVNITSSSTKRVLDNLLLSNVFRMGIVGLAKTLAREAGGDNILVNTVGPGKIATERAAQIDAAKAAKTGVAAERVRADSEKSIPLGRYGEPEELARLCLFLGSAANTYVTGQNLLVDGGQVDTY